MSTSQQNKLWGKMDETAAPQVIGPAVWEFPRLRVLYSPSDMTASTSGIFLPKASWIRCRALSRADADLVTPRFCAPRIRATVSTPNP